MPDARDAGEERDELEQPGPLPPGVYGPRIKTVRVQGPLR